MNNFYRGMPTFDIDNKGMYYCPRILSKISLYNERNKHLVRDWSETNKQFEAWVDGVSLEVENNAALLKIREFPLPILDRQLFNNIVLSVVGPERASQFEKNKFYLLDYFFPNLGIAVELDSHWHDNRKDADRIRDLYIESQYDIKTLRIDGYGVRNKPGLDEKFNYLLLKEITQVCNYKKTFNIPIDSHLVIDYIYMANHPGTSSRWSTAKAKIVDTRPTPQKDSDSDSGCLENVVLFSIFLIAIITLIHLC